MIRILTSRRLCALLLFVLCSTAIQAQKTPQQIQELRQKLLSHPNVKEAQISEDRQTPSFISLKSQNNVSSPEAKTLLTTLLETRPGVDELREVRQVQTDRTFKVIEYNQYYKGIKVDRARFTALVKNEQVKFFNGAFYEVSGSAPTQPALDKKAAVAKAKAAVNARKLYHEVLEEQFGAISGLGSKSALQAEIVESLPNGELVYIKDFNKPEVAEIRLAFKFNIYSAEPFGRAWVYIDAVNGKVLLVDQIIKHVDGPNGSPTLTSIATTVKTRYAGNRTIYTKQISGNDPNNGQTLVASNPNESYTPGAPTHVLIDDTKTGTSIETYDLNGVGGLPLSVGAAYSLAKSFTDVDNNWTLAEHNRIGANAESENDDIAWDAHWGAGMVYDYWKEQHNRLSFDGTNGKIKSYIHSGIGYDNAFWNGKVMTYGDGSYNPPAKTTGFRPLTSLDVCAHEIGHGVCSFTSDLVYARESGAMNEGFSDVWAACAEYYALKKDPSLGAVYKPFYIGEQIAVNPAVPLRRMDDPLARNNPDTYGGRRWTSQVGCTPTLANDQCGVHNNSGVLNKWFYLLTVGSGAGSGPDAAFAGVDDGINDKNNTYSVTGIGFLQSENIAYLTELLLTSTATFAEARDVSIGVATDISGNPCSGLVETVTNAWYAVGVGDQFVKPCTITYGFSFQPGITVSEGNTTVGCTSEKAYNVGVVLPPNSTATITTSGTASNGTDYTLSGTSLSNTSTQLSKHNVVVTVKNDGVVEGDETVVLTVAVTNTSSNPVNTKYTLTINDDDVVPVIGNTEKTLLSESFNRADGFADPAGWREIMEVPEAAAGDPTGGGKNQWGIFDNSLSVTGKDGLTNTQLPNSTYNSNSPSQSLVVSPLIDSRGLSVLRIKFDFTVQGEIDPAGTDIENFPAFDYMAVAYSLDGVNFTELNTGDFRQFASASPESGTVDALLPASLSNKQFYLAFRWHNDTNAGGPLSVKIDNLSVTGGPRKIENEQGHGGRQNLDAGQEVYIYSTQDGEIVSKIKNGYNKSYGCTNSFVEKTGTGAFNLYQTSKGELHKVADKIIRIEASNVYKASNTVTLFFTEEQLLALETATAGTRNNFKVYQVQAAAYSDASSTNTKIFTPVFTPLAGIGGTYTFTFNERINGSFALGMQVSAQGTSVNPALAAEETNDWKFAPIYPNPVQNDVFLSVTAPQPTRVLVEMVNAVGQLVYRQNQQLNAGKTQIQLPTQKLKTGTYRVQVKDETGSTLNSQQLIKN